MNLTRPDLKNVFLALLLYTGSPCSSQPPRPVVVERPTITTSVVRDSAAFLIEIKDDNTVWCNTKGGTSKQSQQVEEPIRANLGKFIADYKKERGDRKQMFLIKGSPKSRYDVFEKVIDALRDNEEFKYNLITTEDDPNVNPGPQRMDLQMPKETEQKAEVEADLTLLVLDPVSIYAYEGKNMEGGKWYNFQSIHPFLLDMSKKNGGNFTVVIKPGVNASYKNTVDILDEMTNCKIRKFSMVKISEKEETFIKTKNTRS